MKPAYAEPAVRLAVALIATGSTSWCAAADEPALAPFKLVQGNSKPQITKPAEIFYVKENDKSSHAINAALLSNGFVLNPLSGDGYTSEVVVSASIAKDTVAKKPQDARNVQLAFATEWALPRQASLSSTASVAVEENRITGAKGRMERVDLFVVLPPDLSAALDSGQSGLKTRLYPYAGVYRRHITSTDDASKAPEGRYGGPYAGIDLRVTLGTVGDKSNWLARVTLGLSGYRLRDTSVSSTYQENSYKFGAASIALALYDSEGSAWKPSIALVRSVGTDRLANKEYQAMTKLAFQLSYGL